MLRRFKALLRGPEGSLGSSVVDHDTDELRLAAAALLVEAAIVDGRFDGRERAAIQGMLRTQFGIEAREADAIILEAEKAAHAATQLYAVTRMIRDRYGPEDRIRVVEMLWDVAYADGHLHDHEAHLVQRLAGLLYIPDSASGAARRRVAQRRRGARTGLAAPS